MIWLHLYVVTSHRMMTSEVSVVFTFPGEDPEILILTSKKDPPRGGGAKKQVQVIMTIIHGTQETPTYLDTD